MLFPSFVTFGLVVLEKKFSDGQTGRQTDRHGSGEQKSKATTLAISDFMRGGGGKFTIYF